jgi:hypothetical protein
VSSRFPSHAYIHAYDRTGNSKLANLLHIKALQKRLIAESVPITCIAAHPGATKTVGLDRFFTSIPYVGGLLKKCVAPFFGSWRNGAMTVAFAAAGKEVVDKRETYQGVYMVPIATISPASKFGLDERLQEELYETTEKIISELA